jgi:hypothetical protein
MGGHFVHAVLHRSKALHRRISAEGSDGD